MGRDVGIWIDHRKAHIVAITGKDEEIGLIISKAEKQDRRSEESRHEGPFEPQRVPADDSRHRARTGHLNIYYDAIIACVKGAESILIFGPSEAKDELNKRLKRLDLGGCFVAVETVDKMTDQQIAAKVRNHFAGKHPALA
jgi:hypothetical protein